MFVRASPASCTFLRKIFVNCSSCNFFINIYFLYIYTHMHGSKHLYHFIFGRYYISTDLHWRNLYFGIKDLWNTEICFSCITHGEYGIHMFGSIMTKNNNQYNHWNTRKPIDHLLNEQIVYYMINDILIVIVTKYILNWTRKS